jgi:hypothetical protein
MAGAALSRLWDTNPRFACALQTGAALMMGGAAIAMVVQRNWLIAVILGAGCLIESVTLVTFTREAI